MCIMKRIEHLFPKVQYIKHIAEALISAVLSSTVILATQEFACCFLYPKTIVQI